MSFLYDKSIDYFYPNNPNETPSLSFPYISFLNFYNLIYNLPSTDALNRRDKQPSHLSPARVIAQKFKDSEREHAEQVRPRRVQHHEHGTHKTTLGVRVPGSLHLHLRIQLLGIHLRERCPGHRGATHGHLLLGTALRR